MFAGHLDLSSSCQSSLLSAYLDAYTFANRKDMTRALKPALSPHSLSAWRANDSYFDRQALLHLSIPPFHHVARSGSKTVKSPMSNEEIFEASFFSPRALSTIPEARTGAHEHYR
jgi:hypothetical protein